MAENSSYVLAMYDVRGKQNFIYNGKKIKEIIGASHVIKDVFNDYLYDAAKKYCEIKHIKTSDEEEPIYNYQNHRDKNENFSVSKFEEHMKTSGSEEKKVRNYIGEVVYEGGGNFFVLYCNAEICEGINRIFTAKLLQDIGTLKVLCTYKENLDFSHFKIDRDNLYADHRLNEAQESVIYPVNTLPFVQTAPDSNRPYTDKIVKVIGEEKEKVTTEQKAKYDKYDKYIKEFKNKKTGEDEYDYDYDKEEFLLDYLVEERGTESLLAVIYIDGNNMGAKVQACLEGKTTYDECVNELRSFSEKIQTSRVDERTSAINKRLKEKYKNTKKKIRRTIVAAGDEMTIICNARDALDVVKAYFQKLPEDETACAGIAIFHSHTPYSDAYSIAEECCESCKRYIKDAEIVKNAEIMKNVEIMKDPEVIDLNLMDFHYCQGGIGISLENIRERESGGRKYSRPWRIDKVKGKIKFSPVFDDKKLAVAGKEDQKNDYCGLVDSFSKELNKTARTNVKSLLTAAQAGTSDLEMELQRINAHSKKDKQMDFSKLEGDQDKKDKKRDLIYDIATVYDVWFAEKGEENDDKE